MKLLRNERLSIWLIIIGLLLIIVTIVFFLWEEKSFNPDLEINSDKFAQFGDFVGGIVGTIWALAGVLLFYVALSEQRKDIKVNKEALELQVEALNQQVEEFQLQRKELEMSRKVYELQGKTLKIQQFESNFYSMLNVHMEIKDRLNKQDDSGHFFRDFCVRFMSNYNIGSVGNLPNHHDIMVKSYCNTFIKSSEDLSHYFKTFYRVIKIVDINHSLADEEKFNYVKIIRSQLSEYEQVVLFYNNHSIYGKKSNPLILKYNILKNISDSIKPHFKAILDKCKDFRIDLLSSDITNFIVQNIIDSFDLSFDEQMRSMQEQYFDSFVNLYYEDPIKLEVVFNKNTFENEIKLNSEEFSELLYNIVYDTVVLKTFTNKENVSIAANISCDLDNYIFSIIIDVDQDTVLNLNIDRY